MEKRLDKNVGHIQIDSKTLMQMLDFEGGVIWGVRLDDFGIVELLVQHPDMPKVKEGMPIEKVWISHRATYGDNGVILRTERVDPPKRKSND